MPPGFTRSLADSLNRVCKLEVAEASAGQELAPGRVLIARGGSHLGIKATPNGFITHLSMDPPENSCRPAVDYLLRSLVDTFGASVLTVIMTGMGEDGLRGCSLLREAGARIYAQEESTCVVYGMPRAVIDNGLADEIIPLDQIAARICLAVRQPLPQ